MISKEKLKENVAKTKNTTKEALTTIYEALNQGQQKKLLKNEEVKRLLKFYGVIEEGEN
ncbi:MAG: hypothetical protein VZR95_06965 [Alphaproteobacteria bacterium]